MPSTNRLKAIATLDDDALVGAARSERVRNFYERYPYPRPVDTLDAYRERWNEPARRRADHHLHWPARPFTDSPSILIAGCGTSQAVKHAMRWPAARVTGIDFSAASVAATERLKRKYRLRNLEVLQLPVERVGELGTRFDQIVCTGVIHHLVDPDAGLRALRQTLDDDGAMHLMVYAPHGRAGIYMLQQFCRRLDIPATDDGIRELMAALRELPRGHPLERLLRDAPDFREEAALADALLNPQDRAYSVPELFEFLARAGLSFGRWNRQAPYTARCGALARIPQAPRMTALPANEESAAAELFRGTMARHSVIAYGNDDSRNAHAISFAESAWLDYVPIAMPDTLRVVERAPPSAAAVLINRTHPFTDIYLPIDGPESRMLRSMDGVRSLRAIAQAHGDVAATRSLFERLWWHDQVVFDTSLSAVAQ